MSADKDFFLGRGRGSLVPFFLLLLPSPGGGHCFLDDGARGPPFMDVLMKSGTYPDVKTQTTPPAGISSVFTRRWALPHSPESHEHVRRPKNQQGTLRLVHVNFACCLSEVDVRALFVVSMPWYFAYLQRSVPRFSLRRISRSRMTVRFYSKYRRLQRLRLSSTVTPTFSVSFLVLFVP